mgnify:CR=1 FL=1
MAAIPVTPDDARHAAELEPRGIHFMDCGVSGGVWGIDRGYALMVGGSEEDFERARPIFEALKPEGDSGLVLAGPVGGGISPKWCTTASNTA